MKLEGFDDLERQLRNLEKKIKSQVEGEVSLGELFTPAFMAKHTDFQSIDEFFKESSFEVNSQEDFETINLDELNNYVAKRTRFRDWGHMKQKAAEEYVRNKLKL